MQFSSLDGQTFDVIVSGAGAAGVAAACASARAGASTLLLERYGFCGGTPTAAMIHTFDAIKSCRDHDVVVVAGVARELLHEIEEMGGMASDDNPSEALSFHPEFLKIAADRLLRRRGVRVLFYAPVVAALTEQQRVRGVEAALRDGRARFKASVVVDATGDADVAFLADAAYELDKELQALTYHFRLGNVSGGKPWDELERACVAAMQAAHDAGQAARFGGPWLIRLADGEISVNSTRVYANPVDPTELTAAEMEGREAMLTIWHSLRARVPELRESYILSGATQLHIRESRKVVGEYMLTEEDIVSGRRFDDAVAVGAWPIDIHPSNGFVGVHPHKENPPAPYEIPYRCLVPRTVDNLLVAGRPISTTHRAHGSTRVPGTSMATGQAAGVAAALSAKTGNSPRALDVEALRDELRRQGAIISAGEQIEELEYAR